MCALLQVVDVRPFFIAGLPPTLGSRTSARNFFPWFTRPRFELGHSSPVPQVSYKRVRLSCSINSRVSRSCVMVYSTLARPRHTPWQPQASPALCRTSVAELGCEPFLCAAAHRTISRETVTNTCQPQQRMTFTASVSVKVKTSISHTALALASEVTSTSHCRKPTEPQCSDVELRCVFHGGTLQGVAT